MILDSFFCTPKNWVGKLGWEAQSAWVSARLLQYQRSSWPFEATRIRGRNVILPAQIRAERLRTLRADKAKSIGTEKIFYKGSSQRFDVFQIDLDLLIYNRHN